MRLFHNGQVCGKVGIKHLVKAESAQCRSHFPLNICTDRHTECLAERRADRRCGMHNHELIGVIDRFQNLVGIVFFNDCARRAVYDALSAGDARHIGKVFFKCRTDVRVKAARIGADDRNALRVACGDTAAAKDTFVVVANHMCGRGIQVIADGFARECFGVVHTVILAELLQFAVAAAHTGQTFFVMRGKNQLQRGFARMADTLGVGENLHPLIDGIYACGHKASCTLDLDHADTACADFVDVL